MKMALGVLADQNEVKSMHTTVLDHETVEQLRGSTVPLEFLERGPVYLHASVWS